MKTALCWMAWGIIALTLASAAWAQAGAGDAARLDDSILAETLQHYQMKELFDALLAQTGKDKSAQSGSVRVQALVMQAKAARDDATRKARFEEALKLQEELVRQAKPSSSANDVQVVGYYRTSLDKVILQGLTMTDAPMERIQYFLGRPRDAEAVEHLTGGALATLDELLKALGQQQDAWNGDDEKMITGVLWRLEELGDEARYRGAWIRYYRAVVLSEKDPVLKLQREALLRQAIEDVAVYATAADNSSGIKYLSLLLTGMAYREMDQFDQAFATLRQAAAEEAGPTVRVKAYFETAHGLIDQGKFDKAGSFIDIEFAALGKKLGAGAAVMVETQSTLLRSQLLEVQSHAAAASGQTVLANALMDQAVQKLLDYAEAHPNYREAFMEVVAPKYEGRDPKELRPDICLFLGLRAFNKGTPDSLAEARTLLELAGQPQLPPEMQGRRLWYLGLIANRERKNREAARWWRELAQKYPQDVHARDAARDAVKSLQGVLMERKVEPARLGTEFVQEYAQALQALVDGWGGGDPSQRDRYTYELGMQYETLGQADKAVAQFNHITPSGELYVPSRYRILIQRTDMLVENAQADPAARRQAASTLLLDMEAFDKQAKASLAATRPAQAKELADMAAHVRLLEAQVLKDVLDKPEDAMLAAQAVAKEWPDVEQAQRRSKEFIVRLLLEKGQTDQALAALNEIKGGEDLVAQAIAQVGSRIDTLEAQNSADSPGELARYRQAYRVFAQRLFESVKSRQLTAEQSYPFRQALARSYEFGEKEQVAQAAALFKELDAQRPNDFVNLRGLARCHRRMGEVEEAMSAYNRLVDGLNEDSRDWWRMQIERLAYYLEARKGDPKAAGEVLLQIRTLRNLKGDKMLSWKQFGELEQQASVARGVGAASTSAPAPSSAPASRPSAATLPSTQ